MKLEVDISSIEQTIALAEKLASQLINGDIITLKGDLGAGKTTISKYIISILLGKETKVISPTFQLLQIYQAEGYIIYHYDLYRLKNSEEIYELGIEDAFNNQNIVLIEWPEIIMNLLPGKIINLEISLQNNTRKCIIDDNTNRLSL